MLRHHDYLAEIASYLGARTLSIIILLENIMSAEADAAKAELTNLLAVIDQAKAAIEADRAKVVQATAEAADNKQALLDMQPQLAAAAHDLANAVNPPAPAPAA